MSKETGVPAFPVVAELCQDLTVEEQRGISIRDYFAAKAMPSILEQMDVCNGQELTNSACTPTKWQTQ